MHTNQQKKAERSSCPKGEATDLNVRKTKRPMIIVAFVLNRSADFIFNYFEIIP